MQKPESSNKARIVVYWLTTGLVFLAFAVPGFGNLLHIPHIARDMAHLGYPAYFLTIFGIWKILGAVAIVVPRFPRLKEWAYAGMIFDLTGAAASRAVMRDGVAMVVIPLVIATVVVASWSLRPPGRILNAS